jgi:hypothetical protein
MAHTALDTRSPAGLEPAQYWGGYERIARTWRSPWPDEDTPEDAKRRRTILNEVRKALRALEAQGAVKAVGPPPVPGRAQAYALTL